MREEVLKQGEWIYELQVRDQNLEEENYNLKNLLLETNFKQTKLLNTEISARNEQGIVLQSLIDTEISARKEQVNVLQAQFSTEISSRKEKDNVLQSSIDAINAKPR